MHTESSILTLLPRVEIAQPARDPAAPAAVFTRVAETGAAIELVILSTPLTTAISGFSLKLNQCKSENGNQNEPSMRHVPSTCPRITPKL